MAAGACDHCRLLQPRIAMAGGACDPCRLLQTPIAMAGGACDHCRLLQTPIAMAQHTPLPYTACGTAARSTVIRFLPAQAPLRCWTQRMSCLEAWEDAMYDSQTTIACVPSMRCLEVGEEAMSHSSGSQTMIACACQVGALLRSHYQSLTSLSSSSNTRTMLLHIARC